MEVNLQRVMTLGYWNQSSVNILFTSFDSMISTYQIHNILTPKKEKVNLIENSLVHYPTPIHSYLCGLPDTVMCLVSLLNRFSNGSSSILFEGAIYKNDNDG